MPVPPTRTRTDAHGHAARPVATNCPAKEPNHARPRHRRRTGGVLRTYVGAEPAPPRPTAAPRVGDVCGLGLVEALRIDVQPAQLPWLTAEIDIVHYCLEDELAHQRARHDEPPEAVTGHGQSDDREAEQELGRRAYQLQALGMIRRQLPISREAAAAAVANPWDTPSDDATPGPDGPVVIVGPAALMTVLLRGATRHVADALAEALSHPALDVDEYTDSSGGWREGELPRVEPVIAERLRATAAAAKAFTDSYLDVLAHQGYRFDPGPQPVRAEQPE